MSRYPEDDTLLRGIDNGEEEEEDSRKKPKRSAAGVADDDGPDARLKKLSF